MIHITQYILILAGSMLWNQQTCGFHEWSVYWYHGTTGTETQRNLEMSKTVGQGYNLWWQTTNYG
jgi:hypothetical protein